MIFYESVYIDVEFVLIIWEIKFLILMLVDL